MLGVRRSDMLNIRLRWLLRCNRNQRGRARVHHSLRRSGRAHLRHSLRRSRLEHWKKWFGVVRGSCDGGADSNIEKTRLFGVVWGSCDGGAHSSIEKNDSELLEEAVMREMTNGAFYLSGKRGNNSASSLAPWSPDDSQAICQQNNIDFVFNCC